MTDSLLKGTIIVRPSPDAVAAECASWLLDIARSAIASKGSFTIALSGGSTPKALFGLLAGAANPAYSWANWHVYFVDERGCPPDDASSNYHLAQTLFEAVPIPASHIHRMEGEIRPLEDAASRYARHLAELPQVNRMPNFDCILLGMGADGHTASLFPDTDPLHELHATVVTNIAPVAPHERLSITFPVINAANHVAFLVTGSEKGPALAKTVAGTTPAAHVDPAARSLYWFLDQSAYDALDDALQHSGDRSPAEKQ
ncbi:MAG: 6-phosphogluconolactonase [Candidatus Dormibacteria bacterium]